MHDIKDIILRLDWYVDRFTERGIDARNILERVIKKRKEYNQVLTELEVHRNIRKVDSETIAMYAKEKNAAANKAMNHQKALVRKTNQTIARYEGELNKLDGFLDELKHLPNIAAEDVPYGDSEKYNIEFKKWTPNDGFNPLTKDHVTLGLDMGLMDFEQTTKIAGSRYVTLKGGLATLERALGQFMLNRVIRHGYVEHQVPYIVNDHAMYGTGQFPKFQEDVFATSHGGFLIPTSEVSLTNQVNGKLLDQKSLPLRMCALTPCFRAEAGSAGRDTRGIIRQHQFNKVEMVAITDNEDAEQEQERMLIVAQKILQYLELPYRVVHLCTGDLGFSSRKTYDIEVWLPSQQTYREISSISDCGDFQGRRMNARYKDANSKTQFVHTFNGSGLAVGRTLVAVMENYQREDGSIRIPPLLYDYMKPYSFITKDGHLTADI